jgi:hypothetical protein
MGVSSFRQAKQRLIDLIKLTKEEHGYDSSGGYQGIDDPLAKSLGIEVEEHYMPFDLGTYIAANPPLRPKPVIWLDPTSADQERLNFSYYHEISHHLIRSDNDLYGFLSDLVDRNDEFDNLVDRFANIGAAEFLIPSEDIIALHNTRGFSIQLLPELDERYPASKPAIAIQMAQCASHRCFVTVCQFGLLQNKNQEQESFVRMGNDLEPKLYVQYSSNSPSQEKYSIGKYSVISENHLFYRAYKTQGYVKGSDYIPFKNGRKNWIVGCEALFYKGKVYGAFNVKEPKTPNPNQGWLF